MCRIARFAVCVPLFARYIEKVEALVADGSEPIVVHKDGGGQFGVLLEQLAAVAS